MDLRALETFRAVVECGGISRAAERLHRAQSSVTARIRQLEASLGSELFLREGRSLRLTPTGEVLFGYAGRLLDLAEEARTAVHRDRVCGRLRLGAMESVAASRLPRPLAAFHRQYPEVSVELQTATSQELIARMQAGELDAAVVGDAVDRERFLSTPLYVEHLVLVGCSGCALLDKPKGLAGSTFLVFQGNGCAYRRRLERWLQSLRVVPGRMLEFGSYHAILAASAAGVGVSLVPQSVLDLYPQRDELSLREIPARIARVDTVLIRPRTAHSSLLNRLLESLQADARASAP